MLCGMTSNRIRAVNLFCDSLLSYFRPLTSLALNEVEGKLLSVLQ